MRKLLAVMAVGIGIVSILLTARYGYKQADEEIDRWIAAIMFGAISLCAFVFDALAVRLWFNQWRRTGAFIGFIAGLAFIVTFSNSLGGIVSRSDAVVAQRQDVTDTRAARQRELARLEKQLADLGAFVPADAEAVTAAKTAAETAKSNRTAECETRRDRCRQREQDEAAATTKLANVTTAKATTDRARTIEADIAALKVKMEKPATEAVAHANPLGNAMANIFGSGAEVLTSWQQAVIALVFELCLVGLMVGFEALGQSAEASEAIESSQTTGVPTLEQLRQTTSASPQRAAVSKGQGKPAGSVKAFFHERVSPANGERVEMRTLVGEYREWCASRRTEPIALAGFLEEIEKVCRKVGISIETQAQRVYCLDVKVDPTQTAGLH